MTIDLKEHEANRGDRDSIREIIAGKHDAENKGTDRRNENQLLAVCHDEEFAGRVQTMRRVTHGCDFYNGSTFRSTADDEQIGTH